MRVSRLSFLAGSGRQSALSLGVEFLAAFSVKRLREWWERRS